MNKEENMLMEEYLNEMGLALKEKVKKTKSLLKEQKPSLETLNRLSGEVEGKDSELAKIKMAMLLREMGEEKKALKDHLSGLHDIYDLFCKYPDSLNRKPGNAGEKSTSLPLCFMEFKLAFTALELCYKDLCDSLKTFNASPECLEIDEIHDLLHQVINT